MVTAHERGIPPRRFEHTWPGPAGRWTLDRWGDHGRPILLLHAPLFDRTMWWPVAADLVGAGTVIAVDLPGHGQSSGRRSYDPWMLVDELGQLVDDLGLRRAPVVVGHGPAGLLASMFAARFTVRGVVTAGQSLDVRPLIDVADRLTEGRDPHGETSRFLAGIRLDAIPPMYQGLAVPRADPELLAGHLRWLSRGAPDDVIAAFASVLRQIRAPHLNVFGQLPRPGYERWLRGMIPGARCVAYDRSDHFPHLTEVTRFAADIRTLL